MNSIKEEFQKYKQTQEAFLNREKSRLEGELYKVNAQLEKLKYDVRNHIYASVEDAMREMEDLFYTQAREDCEGSYNIGNPEYTQEFIVDGILYEAIGRFEYNRHDKTYYYVDGTDYTYKEIGPYTE